MRFNGLVVLIAVLLIFAVDETCGRRGRGRGRSKSRVSIELFINLYSVNNGFFVINAILIVWFISMEQVQIGLPITGKYRDPESDQYYNNNNVSEFNRVVCDVCWCWCEKIN